MLQAVLLYYWRRAARIVPAHWVSLLVAYFLMVRDREWTDAVPEAAGSLLHYPAQDCPSECLLHTQTLQLTAVLSAGCVVDARVISR